MLEISFEKRSYKVKQGEEKGQVLLNGEVVKVDILPVGDRQYHMIMDGKSYEIEEVDNADGPLTMKINGRLYHPSVKDDTDLLLERLGMNLTSKKALSELKAPMPGLVLDIKCEPGQEIKEGQALIVLEAMKMENVLKAPADVVVKNIPVDKGQAIDKNAILITFE